MTDIRNLNIHIGQLKTGQWVAATGSSPYFCVEAESEPAVKKLAKEAIGFYTSVLREYGGSLPRHIEEPTFTSTITAGELEVA